MKIKALVATLALVISSAGCAYLIPKPYVENKTIAKGDLDVVVTKIYQRDGESSRNGTLVYYPPKDHTFFSVYIQITNNSKKIIKTDLNKAYLIEGDKALPSRLCIQGRQFYPLDDVDPVKELEPGDSITRNLVYIMPKGQVPDAFVWKGVGSLKIPQTLPKKDDKK